MDNGNHSDDAPDHRHDQQQQADGLPRQPQRDRREQLYVAAAHQPQREQSREGSEDGDSQRDLQRHIGPCGNAACQPI